MSSTEPPTCVVHRKPGSSRVGARRPPVSADDPVASLPCVLCPPRLIGSVEPVALLITWPLNEAERHACIAGLHHAAIAHVVHQECVDALNESELLAVVNDLARSPIVITLGGKRLTWTGEGRAEPDPTMPFVSSIPIRLTTADCEGENAVR